MVMLFNRQTVVCEAKKDKNGFSRRQQGAIIELSRCPVSWFQQISGLK